MRIRGAKSELEEAGLETDGMVESTSKLRQEILALSGVDIMENNNTFKSTYQILDELSLKWQDLSDIQQATITELIAGKRQGNIVSSLMNNFETARSALETSLKSSGSAMKEHEKWQESLEARINSLKASWQSLSQNFMKSNFLKWGMDRIIDIVDAIDSLIDRFGVINTALAGRNIINVFKRGFALDADGNRAGAYWDIVEVFQSISYMAKDAITATGGLKQKFKDLWFVAKHGAKDFASSLKPVLKDIAKVVVIMNTIKAVQDIFSWISEAGKNAETSAEKFDRISDELSDAESELRSLESELSSVESQIDALLEKDELTYADEEELQRLREISSELERQIQLTETLQKSLSKSLSETAVDAYGDYVGDTSFYSVESKSERKEAAKSLGSSIGNIVGLVAGAAIGTFVGNPIIGAAIGSTVGSGGGSLIGGAISNASYDSETTVLEMLDRMHVERTKLERAKQEAQEAYVNNKDNKELQTAYEKASSALDDYNTSLAEHIQYISELYNSMDYDTLDLDGRKRYLEIGDILDTYNIEMGVQGAKSTALDRIFSDELIDEKANEGARELKTAIQNAIDAGGEIDYDIFNSEKFAEVTNRLAEMGVTVVDVVGYFKELEEAQSEAFDYDTYDIVSNVATLAEGVTALTDAFTEFNEQGVVSAATLAELNEVFGSAGDAWTDYVNVMSNGISSIEDAREATEQLAEAHLGNLLSNGGIRFQKFNEETNDYELDTDNYGTYLSTISQLENIGVENAKEYLDALQQRAMIEELAAQERSDMLQEEALLAKLAEESLTKEEEILLAELQSRDINERIEEIQKSYGVSLRNVQIDKDRTLLDAEIELDELQASLKEKENALSDIKGFLTSYDTYVSEASNEYNNYEDALAKVQALENEIVQDNVDRSKYGTSHSDSGIYMPTWNDFEAIDDLLGTEWIDTDWDKVDQANEDAETYYENYKEVLENNKKNFDELVEIADEYKINLDDIIPEDMIDSDGNYDFDATSDNAKEVFQQVYDRVKSELEISIEEYEKLADDLSTEIQDAYENLGLDIDFGRYFDKIIMDGFNTKVEQINTARSEMFSTGGLSTDSIMAIDEIFGDLSSYDSSKLFENTANGVRLNTTEFRKLNNEFKKTNINNLESQISDLGDQYIETREELYNLTYGTSEYNAKLRELTDIEEQIASNEELLSSYQGLFSAFQEWQNAEASGSERGMYETILEGWESVGDEISRGWIDDGTREFLELIKGDTVEIVDANGVTKEINLATASAKELKQVWKDMDDTIEHTSYSIRDFFTVDEDGNSTSQGVYNFLDAIGQLEEEEFDYKDVVKRDSKGNIIGFDFQIVGGDEAIAEALGVSEELVQIMKRAAIDAGFVVTFDGSYESLDVMIEKAETSVKDMNEKLKKSGKSTIDIDMNVDSVEDIDSQINKIMGTFGEKEDGKLTGAINMDVEGADEAVQIVSTLQSMKDKLTRPAYMEVEISEVEEDLREPLQNLQDYRTKIEQLNQAKLRGADTTELEESIEESKKKVVDDLIEIQESNPELAAELEIKGLSREEIEKKVEAGEITIPATIDIQLEMSESLDILALTALKEQGLISDEEYVKRVSVYLDTEVDSDDAENEVDGAVEDVTDGESRETNIKIIAETFGVEDVDALSTSMDGLTDEQVKAIAEAVGKGDVDALDSAVDGMDDKTVEAIANALGYDSVESLKSSMAGMEDKNVNATATTTGKTEVDNLNSSLDTLKQKDGTKVTITTVLQTIKETISRVVSGGKSKAAQRTGADPDGSGVNGTANVNGTAFKQGSWGTKGSGTALVGEIGRETLVRDGRYYTIGDSGAEFIKYKKGDIIFNHKQTEELFANGKVTSGGGRAKAFVVGTAFANGSYPSSGAAFNNYKWDGYGEWIAPEVTSFTVGKDYSSSSSNSGSDESQEIIDWIEVAIKRIEREIDNLDQKASNVYKSWSSRSEALADQINMVSNEIELQQDAYEAYMDAANEIGLSSEWRKKVQNGAIDIDNITDEALAEKISDYQEWYEKALACQDAILELQETESSLYVQRFENIQTQYDGILQGYEHTEAMLNEYIAQAEEQGYIVSKKYYDALIENEKSNIAELKKEQADLIAERDNAVAEGKIVKGSEAWYEQCAAIDEVTQAIEEANTALLEYDNAIRDIDWQIFDIIQERISDVTEEADFLIELMSNKKLYDDDGKLTSQGLATMGLHAQNYNTHMYAADTYGAEVTKLDKQIAKDPYDQELINRRNELLELQRESILAAEDEKNAIRDMVEEGIELELSALSELIDKKNEELESERDLYEYQKKVKEQTEEIASLEKQMAAYSGDDSEEAKQKIQQIKVDLETAREDLQETEYDKLIDDTSSMLDTLYDEYELVLNTRLDNIDYLLEQVVESINATASADGTIATALGSDGAIAIAVSDSATSIKETLTSETNKVGVTLSSAMNSIWSGGDGDAKSVLTMYGEDFRTKSATVITTLNGIRSSVNSMVSSLNKEATTKTTANKTTTSAKKNPTVTNTSKSNTSTSNKPKITDGIIQGVAAAIWIYGKDSGWGNNPFRENKLTQKLGAANAQKVQEYVNKHGANGDLYNYWSKQKDKSLAKYKYSAFKSGAKLIDESQLAWTQEGYKQEFIVRPSDGAILTPVAKSDSVLNAAASSNIWDMANSPAEFIKDNLGIGSTNVPNNSTVQSSYTQHIDNVVFRMDNVKNYEEMLSAMQKDKNFERLILSMSIDRIAGKSGLAKGKSIR